MHLVLLPSLSVEERARPYQPLHVDLEDYVRNSFLPIAFLVAEKTLLDFDPLDIDGRVFLDLLHFLLCHPALLPQQIVGDEVYNAVEALWVQYGLPSVDFEDLAARFPSMLTPSNPSSTVQLTMLPFSNPVFDRPLSSINTANIGTDTEISFDGTEFNMPFVDGHHWHNHRRAILPKHLGGEDAAPQDDWQRKRQLRSDQRLMSKMQWQAESLTGALGRPLQRITIVSVPQSSKRAIIPQRATQESSKSKKVKKEHVSKAEEIRRQHAAKKQTDQNLSNATWWLEILKTLNELSSTASRVASVERLLNNSRTDQGWLAVDIQLYRLHLEFSLWIEHPDADSNNPEKQAEVRDSFTVTIMRLVKDIYERGDLSPAAQSVLETALHVLGFKNYASSFLSASPRTNNDDKKLSFKFVKLARSKSASPIYKFMEITEDPIIWQLRLFGQYMDRSMDSEYDHRVSFKPDAWQRRVLDSIDQNHSLLVVAPTSAGKTFISYYAMEQVLRASDEGVLVYVAPTKALVSQIAAEVYARFSKDFRSGGHTCWAVHTRDYRIHNPQNCQILITVPEMLGIMLLSPPLAQVWTPRIKRIILDEIHTIGQQEGGAVWEQIILLAPCPIIGLSATIGQPEEFNAWLKSVQEAHGYQHTFIHHAHRYSHLRKYSYILDTKASPFKGLDNFQNTGRLHFLHPASMLSFGGRTLPPDFSLEAADCLTLFTALVSQRDRVQFDSDSFDPMRFFNQTALLTQKDILGYEAILRDTLSEVIAISDPHDESSPLNAIVRQVQDPAIAEMTSAQQNDVPSPKQILSNLIHLVSDLHTSGDLPALLFHFDRSGCEIAAKSLVTALDNAEKAWQGSSPQWKKKLEAWTEWKAGAAARANAASKLLKQNKRLAKDAQEHSEATWEESFNPRDPLPQFSFLGPKCSKSQLDEAIRDIEWTSTPRWAITALRRGVGVHHSGMNKHYRTAVESLYRMGHLQVVFATGTLALGINAPTKTSVFCADSPYLTALMYRQCAGRALMDAAGNPINLFGLATHLYYTEPSNFAIVVLLRSGAIHDICMHPSMETAKRELLILLCHLFGRRYVPKVYTSGMNVKLLLAKSPSKVLLPPLPACAEKVLLAHNKEILRVFKGYALAYAAEHMAALEADRSLPMSKKVYSGAGSSPSPFRTYLKSTSIAAVARSPFVCNSGHNDEFANVEELSATSRSGIQLRGHGIPSLQHIIANPGSREKPFPLNAYLLDFYTHGQTQALAAANGIRRGDVWYLLQDFTLTLKTIRTSIEQFLQSISAASGASAETAEENDLADDLDLPGMDDDEDGETNSFQRPVGASDRDWRVFEVINAITKEFDEKYRAMWA
ncbi:hypothetical protein EW026_g6330 [Hermanssonia centrifuga]|uniref:Helicase ATP-binding domain-containing protein n=1 Tax=Hermanssonia centrifuga TaxID=98765 RepID=A0A4S4KFQ3_9APHY|nr:hypothetical protein EW026_g6330 [Hermanssonia centrifuga]